jgi:SAM-dependent methyltransferase
MLAVASGHMEQNDLAYVLGTAERIPLRDGTCDLAWLSQVWHHIRDRHACASELRRVLRSGRHVLLRGTFGDRLDGFPTLFHYWPAARGICEQLPELREAVSLFEANGFTLTEHRRVHQVTATSLDEFANRTKARADSALVLISDTEFQEGQTAIEAAAAIESTPVPVIEVIDLLGFRSTSR